MAGLRCKDPAKTGRRRDQALSFDGGKVPLASGTPGTLSGPESHRSLNLNNSKPLRKRPSSALRSSRRLAYFRCSIRLGCFTRFISFSNDNVGPVVSELFDTRPLTE